MRAYDRWLAAWKNQASQAFVRHRIELATLSVIRRLGECAGSRRSEHRSRGTQEYVQSERAEEQSAPRPRHLVTLRSSAHDRHIHDVDCGRATSSARMWTERAFHASQDDR